MPTTSYDSPTFVGVAYLSDVAARSTCERWGIKHGVVCIMNDFGILMVSRVGGNTIQVALQCVMMDSRAQLVIISKKTCT